MKKLLITICLANMVVVQSLMAQTIPFLTIQQIQSVSGTNLANCNDSSSYTGKLVVTRGIVVTAPVVSLGGTSSGINALGSTACDGAFYIQNGTGPWSGILVRQSLTMKNGSTGILSLNVGDSVVVRGTVREYARVGTNGHNFPGETHIDLDTTLTYTAAAVNRPVYGPTLINISDLVIGSAANNIIKGEQWEGVFVTIENSIVSQIPNSTGGASNIPAGCSPPSNSRRRRIVVKDIPGNEVVISDRFIAGRFSSPSTLNNNIGDGSQGGANSPSATGVAGGTFVYPSLGSYYTTLSGIVSHWMNNGGGCNSRIIVKVDNSLAPPNAPVAGASTASDQGYVLNPFLSSHYVLGRPKPSITNLITISNNVVVANPMPNQDIVVRSTINQVTSGALNISLIPSSLILKYTTDAFTSTAPLWNVITLSGFSGNDFQATIPGSSFVDGTIVRYFVKATNSDNFTVTTPADTNKANFFTVRANGTTIYDLQYTPYPDGNSMFAGSNGTLGATPVTVTGLVSGSVKEVGVVYLQQENTKEWGGIRVFFPGQISGNKDANVQNDLAFLTTGQRVTIVGNVSEILTETILNATKVITLAGAGNLVYNKHSPSFSANEFEKYEGTLVRIASNDLPFKKLRVVDNYLPSSRGGFAVGTDSLNTIATTIITTGVVYQTTASLLSSSLLTTYLSAIIKRPSFYGTYGPEIPILDSLNLNTKLDSLNGLVSYSFNNFIVTPRYNEDFYGITKFIKSFNPNSNPLGFLASATGTSIHKLTWSIPLNYGGDGFILDYGMPLSTVSGALPILSNFKDRAYYRLGIVNTTTTSFERFGITSTSSGALYRIRGYKISGIDTVSSLPAVELLSNISGSFVAPPTSTGTGTSTSTGLFQDSYAYESDISVYPNPSSEELNYKILLNSIPNELAISIYDIAGRRVSEQIISTPSQEGSIPTNNLIPGVYLAEFRSGGKVISRSRIIRLD